MLRWISKKKARTRCADIKDNLGVAPIEVQMRKSA